MKPSIEVIRLIAVVLISFTHTRNDLESGFAYIIVERLPLFGTAILSIISGYLYYSVSRNKKGLFLKKIKSLAIPYMIANISVLLIVLGLNFFFGYNALNRLSYDSSIIWEGVLSFNSPPINPPTYFIRDIFVIFSIIALFCQREYKALFVVIPLIMFGTLILRNDVAFLFIIGLIFAHLKERLNQKLLFFSTIITTLIIGFWFSDYLKFPVSFLIFIIAIDLDFKFFNTGGYSYLLHLYHAPIIVITYPVINALVDNPLLNILIQIIIAIVAVYVLFQYTKRYKFLKILSGGR